MSKFRVLILMTLTVFLGAGALQAKDKSRYHKIKPTGASDNLYTAISREVRKARKLRLKPVVYIGATWCAPCRLLKLHEHNPLMQDAFQGIYVIELDADQWNKELKRTKYPGSPIPAFFEVKKDGTPTGYNITGAAWGKDIPKNMAPPLKKFFSKIK